MSQVAEGVATARALTLLVNARVKGYRKVRGAPHGEAAALRRLLSLAMRFTSVALKPARAPACTSPIRCTQKLNARLAWLAGFEVPNPLRSLSHP